MNYGATENHAFRSARPNLRFMRLTGVNSCDYIFVCVENHTKRGKAPKNRKNRWRRIDGCFFERSILWDSWMI